MEQEQMMQQEAEMGRATDTVLGHLSLGEVVIPRAFLDDPEVMQVLQQMFEAAGANMAEFTVGDPANKINPETGHPEFFFKKLKKIFKAVAPIALQFIPGIGQAASIALGAGAGLLGGGGLKGAIAGGLGGYAGTGGGSFLGKALGYTGAAATGVGSGLLGAGIGGLSGGLKGAALGGALGGVGGYANAGGFNDTALGRGAQDLFTGASGALDRVSSGANDLYQGSALQSAFKSGGDVLKSIGIDTASSASAPTPSVGGGASSYGPQLENAANIPGFNSTSIGPQPLNAANTPQALNSAATTGANEVAKSTSDYASPLLSALLGNRANSQAEKALLNSQRDNQALLAPYTQGFSFNADNLQNDPGYQFNLAEGQQAQDRAQLARGGFFSGNALKEAQTFGQGLADNTYNSAFNRALQGRQAGLTGALAGAGVNTNIGDIRANAATNQGNLLSGALGSVLGGRSFTNTGALQGGFDLQALMREMELRKQGASSYAGA
jgi:hypothetical protein